MVVAIQQATNRPYEPQPDELENDILTYLRELYGAEGFNEHMERFYKAWMKGLGNEFYINKEDFTKEYIDLSTSMIEKLSPLDGFENLKEGAPIPFMTETGSIINVTNNEISLAKGQSNTESLFEMAFLASRDKDFMTNGMTLEGSPQERAKLQAALEHINTLRGGDEIIITNALDENDPELVAARIDVHNFVQNKYKQPEHEDTPVASIQPSEIIPPSEAMGEGYVPQNKKQKSANDKTPFIAKPVKIAAGVALASLTVIGTWLNSGPDKDDHIAEKKTPDTPHERTVDGGTTERVPLELEPETRTADQIITPSEEVVVKTSDGQIVTSDSVTYTTDDVIIYEEYEGGKESLKQNVTRDNSESYHPLFQETHLISGGYLERRGHRQHKGIDIAAPKGTDIHIPISGIVIDDEYSPSYGNKIVVENLETKEKIIIAHMEAEPFFEKGAVVHAGDIIGQVGNTGRVRGKNGGYHAHVEYIKNGKHADPLKLGIHKGFYTKDVAHTETQAPATAEPVIIVPTETFTASKVNTSLLTGKKIPDTISSTLKKVFDNNGSGVLPSDANSKFKYTYDIRYIEKHDPKRLSLVLKAHESAQKNGIDPVLFVNQIEQETSFNTKSVGSDGEVGLGQYKIATAESKGMDKNRLTDPAYILPKMAEDKKNYLEKYNGSELAALVAHNGGPGKITKIASFVRKETNEITDNDVLYALRHDTSIPKRGMLKNYIQEITGINVNNYNIGLALNGNAPGQHIH